MKIYTKTGDLGETSLYSGKRVLKSSDRVMAYGALDEANSFIGLLYSILLKESHIDDGGSLKNNSFVKEKDAFINERDDLKIIMSTLFSIGAILATPQDKQKKIEEKLDEKNLSLTSVSWLETKIDHLEKYLNELKNFILPYSWHKIYL